eukprot:886501_1
MSKQQTIRFITSCFAFCIMWIASSQSITTTYQTSVEINHHVDHDSNSIDTFDCIDPCKACICTHPSIAPFPSLFSQAPIIPKGVESRVNRAICTCTSQGTPNYTFDSTTDPPLSGNELNSTYQICFTPSTPQCSSSIAFTKVYPHTFHCYHSTHTKHNESSDERNAHYPLTALVQEPLRNVRLQITHTKHKKYTAEAAEHVESQVNECIVSIPDIFIKPLVENTQSLLVVIALSCAAIWLFIKSLMRSNAIAFRVRTTPLFIKSKACSLVLIVLSFRTNSALTISKGYLHGCALQTTSLKCWGLNRHGQCGYEYPAKIGDGPNEMGDFLPNVDAGIDDDIIQMALGGEHTCVLTNTGKVKCWGWNEFGQCGYGHKNDVGDSPGEMGDNLPFVDLGEGWVAIQIALGYYHTCALLSNGTTPNVIKCWGIGGNFGNGGLGYGDANTRGDDANEMGDNLPTIDLGTGFDPIQITAGEHLTCTLSTSNKVKCWGRNFYGQLGLGDAFDRGGLPGQSVGQMGDGLPFVELGSGFTPIQVEAGCYHVCALSDSGDVKCWGWNQYGQLGIGHTNNTGDDTDEMGDLLPMVELGSDLTATHLTAGRDHTCALFTSGNIKCWGKALKGALGYGNTNDVGGSPGDMGDSLPFVDLGLDYVGAVSEVNAGYLHTCATFSSAELKCWGSNDEAELGYGNSIWIGNGPNQMGDYLPTVDLGFPSMYPTSTPSSQTNNPSSSPTSPTDIPTTQTSTPTSTPTSMPTNIPTSQTNNPSSSPTDMPTSQTSSPTSIPTNIPSSQTNNPTSSPTSIPTNIPTSRNPTSSPTSPTDIPTSQTNHPTSIPTSSPTDIPTGQTNNPTSSPTSIPTDSPTSQTNNPTYNPTSIPTSSPTSPTDIPTGQTNNPTSSPTSIPTNIPTSQTKNPTDVPTVTPTVQPTIDPTPQPTPYDNYECDEIPYILVIFFDITTDKDDFEDELVDILITVMTNTIKSLTAMQWNSD